MGESGQDYSPATRDSITKDEMTIFIKDMGPDNRKRAVGQQDRTEVGTSLNDSKTYLRDGETMSPPPRKGLPQWWRNSEQY